MVSVGRTRGYTVGLVLLVLMVGGCIGADDVEVDDDEKDKQMNADGDEGSVTGRILTIDLDPIEAASVRLVLDEELVAEETTDARGAYEATGLEPGLYRLQASAACCKEAVRAVQVVAGESASADLQMEPYSDDDLQEPRVERYEWQGQIGCSVRVAGSGINLGCADPNEDRIEEFEIKKGLKTLVVGMTWDPVTDNVNEELVLRHYKGSGWSGYTFFRVNSAPPIEVRVDEDGARDGEDLHYTNIEDSWDVRFQVWTGGTNSISYQQPFTVWYDLYYWEPAPEDATALPDL